MIELAFPNKTYSVKSELSELNIQEYEDIASILSDENKSVIEKYIDVLVYLGVDVDFVESMSLKSLIEFIKVFIEGTIEMKITKSFIIDGYEYVAIEEGEDEPRITPRVTKHIEKIITSRHKGYMSEIAAVLLKRSDLTIKEHYESSHIKHKSKLIKENLLASDVIPHIVFATNGIMINIKDIVGDVS
jgi:hypothetical protein